MVLFWMTSWLWGEILVKLRVYISSKMTQNYSREAMRDLWWSGNVLRGYKSVPWGCIKCSISLQQLSAWTNGSNESWDWPVWAVCPIRFWTDLSEQSPGGFICLDRQVWPLVGRPCLRTSWTGQSDNSLKLLVQADSLCSEWHFLVGPAPPPSHSTLLPE